MLFSPPLAAWPLAVVNSVPLRCNLFPAAQTDRSNARIHFSLSLSLSLTLGRVLERERVLVRLAVEQGDGQGSRAGSVRDRRVQTAERSSRHVLVRRLRDPNVVAPETTNASCVYKKKKRTKKEESYLQGLSIVTLPSPQWCGNAMLPNVATITHDGHVTNSRLH